MSRQDNSTSTTSEDSWVICRVFRKKNYQKTIDESPTNIPTPTTTETQNQLLDLSSKKVLDQIFSCMGKPTKMTTYHQDHQMNNHDHPTTSCTGNTNYIYTYTVAQNIPNIPQKSLIIHDNHINSTLLQATNDHQYNNNNNNNLPMLTSSSPTDQFDHDPIINMMCYEDDDDDYDGKQRLSDWMTLDRLIASQLNGNDQDLCFRADL